MGRKRCPVCGRFNPKEAEYCEYCQADLTFNPDASGNETGHTTLNGEHTSAKNDDQNTPVPDWLDSLITGNENYDPFETLPPFTKKGSSRPSADDSSVDTRIQGSQKPEETKPAGMPHRASSVGTPSPVNEGSGPLAGLQGTLAPARGLGQSKKTPTQPSLLKVTANQRANADLFKQLVDSEGQPLPDLPKSKVSSRHIFRWGVAVCILLGVIWPILNGSREMPLPTYQAETAELNRLINELPENAHVLIGYDYEASYAAEMDSAASAVIDHVMLRGARLTLVSTKPFGPLLAERFLARTRSEHNYIPGLNYVNLGYIPGGIAGLAGFLENPQRILPYSIDGIAAWQTDRHPALAPLQGIGSITDFDMILVIVADPDNARMWIEQLRTYLASPDELTSLTMITSAQAEPVVLPYFENIPRQVHGLVSGLRGGAAYARLTGRNTLPLMYWDAFGVGMFLAALLILIGGLTYSVLSVLTVSPPARKEASR